MGRSLGPMSEKTKTGSDLTAAPRLIVPMSLPPAIPRRVALQQSSPPLHRLGVILNKKAKFEKQKPWNGKCASSKLSQLRGSVQVAVLHNGEGHEPPALTTNHRRFNADADHSPFARGRRTQHPYHPRQNPSPWPRCRTERWPKTAASGNRSFARSRR